MVKSTVKGIKEIMFFFFKNPSVKEMNLKFDKPLKISRKSYDKLVGYYNDGDSTVSYNGVYIDKFSFGEDFIDENMEKRIVTKLSFEYFVDEDKAVNIKEIRMWREIE